MPEVPLKNLPLRPLIVELQRAVTLLRKAGLQDDARELEHVTRQYSEICFECRVVQYPDDDKSSAS